MSELKLRIEKWLDNASLQEVAKLASHLTLVEGWQKLESEYSGDYLSSMYGHVTHTNGHFTVGRKTWFFSKEHSEFAVQTSHGSAESTSNAIFNIPLLEKWYEKNE